MQWRGPFNWGLGSPKCWLHRYWCWMLLFLVCYNCISPLFLSTAGKTAWEVEQQQLAKVRSLADKWREVSRRIELWVGIQVSFSTCHFDLCFVFIELLFDRNKVLLGNMFPLRWSTEIAWSVVFFNTAKGSSMHSCPSRLRLWDARLRDGDVRRDRKCFSPVQTTEAARFVSRRGFVVVAWQVERRGRT